MYAFEVVSGNSVRPASVTVAQPERAQTTVPARRALRYIRPP
jgi:hypothetical protein